MYNKRQRTSHKTYQILKLFRNYVSPGTCEESLEVPVTAAADLDTWNPTHAVMGQLSGAVCPSPDQPLCLMQFQSQFQLDL